MYSKLIALVIAVNWATVYSERLYTAPSMGTSVGRSQGSSQTAAKPSSSGRVSPAAGTGQAVTGPVNPFNISFVVAAKDLPAKKKGAKADPYVKVFQRTGTIQEQPDWTLIGQSETIKSNNDPIFAKVFSFEWIRGKNQQFHFEVKGHHSIKKDDSLGQVDLRVDDYVLQNHQDVTLKLSDGGTLTVKKVQPVKFQLYARTVPKMDPLNGASDPFVVCYWRLGKDGPDVKFYTTKVVKDSENPDWNETIEFPNYQKGTDMWWHFKVFDEDSVGSNDVVGEALVEIDPFVQRRAAKQNQLSKDPKNKAVLTVTPV